MSWQKITNSWRGWHATETVDKYSIKEQSSIDALSAYNRCWHNKHTDHHHQWVLMTMKHYWTVPSARSLASEHNHVALLLWITVSIKRLYDSRFIPVWLSTFSQHCTTNRNHIALHQVCLWYYRSTSVGEFDVYTAVGRRQNCGWVITFVSILS